MFYRCRPHDYQQNYLLPHAEENDKIQYLSLPAYFNPSFFFALAPSCCSYALCKKLSVVSFTVCVDSVVVVAMEEACISVLHQKEKFAKSILFISSQIQGQIPREVFACSLDYLARLSLPHKLGKLFIEMSGIPIETRIAIHVNKSIFS